jgi:DNA-binding CsgD family transcriptional regulator
MAKINKSIAQKIIEEYLSGVSTYEIADKHNIWQTTVCNVVSGRSWKECVRPENIHEIINQKKEKNWLTGKQCKVLPDLSDIQKNIIIGSLLGDGYINKCKNNNNKNSQFSKKQKYDKKEYLDWHFEKMENYSNSVKPIYSCEKLSNDLEGKIIRNKSEKFLSSYLYNTYSHPNITKFREIWYPDGKKIIPNDLILNAQIIAIWFCDDGYNSFKQRFALLCTQSFSIEEVNLLQEKFKDFDIKTTIQFATSHYDQRKMPMIKFTSNSYDNLINLIKPHVIWDCFKYKIEWRQAKKHHEIHGRFTKEQIDQIIQMRKTHTSKEIAKIYNIHVNSIYSIVSRRSYKNL